MLYLQHVYSKGIKMFRDSLLINVSFTINDGSATLSLITNSLAYRHK